MESVAQQDIHEEPRHSSGDMCYLRALLNQHGIPESSKGHGYIMTAVILGSSMGVLNGRITKELYPEIARIHGTTSKNVERAIRGALVKCYSLPPANASARPSNGEFLAKIIQQYLAHYGAFVH